MGRRRDRCKRRFRAHHDILYLERRLARARFLFLLVRLSQTFYLLACPG
jgi:hypothetical protein